MNITTARRAAWPVAEDVLRELGLPLYSSHIAIAAHLIARAIRREAIAYHRRALQAARNRGKR